MQEFDGGAVSTFLSFHPLPSVPSLICSPHLPFPSLLPLPLEVGPPLNQLVGLGSAVAPRAEKEFGALQSF